MWYFSFCDLFSFHLFLMLRTIAMNDWTVCSAISLLRVSKFCYYEHFWGECSEAHLLMHLCQSFYSLRINWNYQVVDMCIFNLKASCQGAFPRGCHYWHSRQHCVSSHLSQYLKAFCLLYTCDRVSSFLFPSFNLFWVWNKIKTGSTLKSSMSHWWRSLFLGRQRPHPGK